MKLKEGDSAKIIGNGNPITHNFRIGTTVKIEYARNLGQYKCIDKNGYGQVVSPKDLKLITSNIVKKLLHIS